MYFINYDYGMHKILVKTDAVSFYNVIDDLSLEFEINKTSDTFVDDEGFFKKKTFFQIINYCGDLETIGFILEDAYNDLYFPDVI